MLLVDALYINDGGGKALLDYFIDSLEVAGVDVLYLLDKRCEGDYPFIPEDRRVFIRATLKNRYAYYKKNSVRFSKIFCFGNVPPPVPMKKIKVFVYFHNASLLGQPKNYSLKEKMLKKLKFLYISMVNRSEYIYIVQTGFVKRMLSQKLKNNKIEVLPFFKNLSATPLSSADKIADFFVYVSNGNTHKNHFVLFDAWELMAKNNVFPELHLTISGAFTEHYLKISDLQKKGVRIVNHGFTNPVDLYSRARYSIYPSLIESFGLGLMEAVTFGCDVLAPDLDYVYEVCEPLMVFDPFSAEDVAAKVQEVLLSPSQEVKSKLVICNEISKLLDMVSTHKA